MGLELYSCLFIFSTYLPSIQKVWPAKCVLWLAYDYRELRVMRELMSCIHSTKKTSQPKIALSSLSLFILAVYFCKFIFIYNFLLIFFIFFSTFIQWSMVSVLYKRVYFTFYRGYQFILMQRSLIYVLYKGSGLYFMQCLVDGSGKKG